MVLFLLRCIVANIAFGQRLLKLLNLRLSEGGLQNAYQLALWFFMTVRGAASHRPG
jgi:hypothetical protein